MLSSQTLDVYLGEHVTKDGEWLSTIAEQHDMSWETLYYFNKETVGPNPNLIHPTDTLQIPLYSSLNIPNYSVNYKLEAWVFLCMFAILLWIFYRKKPIKVNTVSSSSPTPVEVTVKGGGLGVSEDMDSVTKEVTIDIPNVVDFTYDKVEGAISSDVVKDSTDTKKLAKKLKKLKKNKG